MSQNEQGMVYAFRLSGSRMRQRAAQLRRQGQVLDALSLVRRAAEQDDTPAAWQTLAQELRQMGNWEAAVQLLARVLSREPHQPGAWADMACCLQALGQNALAVDCAYHQLQEDPWSPEGDAVRAILAELDVPIEGKEPRRTQRLIHRGLTAWQSGDRTVGERRIRRALRLTGDKERLLVTTAMMCMLEADFDGAMRYLPLALCRAPEDARTLTALSTLYHQLGKRRIARGMLEKASKCAETVLAEDGVLAAAWAQDAWPQMRAYLDARMKRLPHRAPLLNARAAMCCEQGDLSAAQQWWKEVLAIDPEDRQAAAMLAQAQEQPEGFLCVPGMLPRSERQRQLVELCTAAEEADLAQMLRCGSRTRLLLDWFIVSGEAAERAYAMQLMENLPGQEAAIPFLKELLCRPFLRLDTRQWALVRLAQLGCRDEMLMMAGNHYTFVTCQKVDENKPRQPWRMFLPLLLQETCRYGQSGEIAEFAASLWRLMTPAQRLEAVGPGRYVWCKAMEILYLRMAGEEELAARVAVSTPLSARKISRVLRRLGRNLTEENVTE